jgi:hypothetical protein
MATFVEDLLVELEQCRDLMMKEIFGTDPSKSSQIIEEEVK